MDNDVASDSYYGTTCLFQVLIYTLTKSLGQTFDVFSFPPWMEETGVLKSMGSQRVRHDLVARVQLQQPGNQPEVVSGVSGQ